MTDTHPEAEARMVDVTAKDVTARTAVATGKVIVSPQTRDLVFSRSLKKGDALAVARVAGIMGAKRTAELIPLCHPIGIGALEVEFRALDDGIEILASAKTNERTGIEMEALTAVATAALTIYDMVKGVERGAEIAHIALLEKSGGKSGDWRRSG